MVLAKDQFVQGGISLSLMISWKIQQHNSITAANLFQSRGIWHSLDISNSKILYFIRNLGHIFQLYGKGLEALILASRAKETASDDTQMRSDKLYYQGKRQHCARYIRTMFLQPYLERTSCP